VTSGEGIERVIQGQLEDEERDGLERSAEVLQRVWEDLRRP
jgi:hypothetical protein